jgi:Fe-S cluster assembly iron-binding protein IscA
MTTFCKHCDKEMSSIRKTKKFCSPICRTRFRIGVQVSKMSSQTCINCGAKFHPTGLKQIRFCSLNCQGIYLHAHSWKKKCNVCVDCQTVFEAYSRKTQRCELCHKKHLSKTVMLNRARRDPTVRVGVGSGGCQKRIDLPVDFVRLRCPRHRPRTNVLYSRWYTCDFCTPKQVLTSDELCLHHVNMDRRDNSDENVRVLCEKHHRQIHQRILKLSKPNLGITVSLCKKACHEMEAELKLRNEAGNSCLKHTGQSEPKASGNTSQGQRIPAGEELPSADTRPQHL